MTTEETKQDVAPQDDAAGVTQSSDGIDWETIYKTPQFQSIVAGYKKEAKEAKAALAAKDAAQSEAERAELEKQAKYQQLYETAEKRAAQLKDELDAKNAAMSKREKQLAIKDAARSNDPPFITEAIDDILLLIQADDLPEGDELPTAAAAQVKALAKAKPWLLRTERSDPGSPPGRKPAGGVGKPTSTGNPMRL
jgi:hypothetical protein